jgi:FAD-dependent halogenase
MQLRHETFDVVVIGAGPAGSTVASFVAMQGHRVLLLEREQLPLWKIGESLLPSTVHGVCAMLGVTKELESAGFVKKLGGTFRWGRNKQPWTFAFASSSRFPGATSYAFQVERMKFDTILVDNARRKGVDVREQHTVLELLVENDRVAGVKVLTDRGARVSIGARYVVDASGYTSRLAQHAGERVFSKMFRNMAVFGYFRGGKRLPPPNSGNIFSVAFNKGWFWYIPLTPTLTSVGAVIGQEHADVLRQDKSAALMQLIGECELVGDMLADASPATEPPYHEVRVRKDFSYRNTSFWRPGFVVIGDAACFIDPLFSSGVHLATYSALLAARSINSCLAGAVDERRAFNEYEQRYLREYGVFHDFLVAFYDLDQDLDGYYWAARKVLNINDMGGEAFIRLVGGMGGSAETLCDPVTGTGVPLAGLGQQLFPAAAGGSDMFIETGAGRSSTTDAAAEATRDQFMTALTAESVQLRAQAMKLPHDPKPMFDDGLVPSSDGLQWMAPVRV